jgi:hypothetical protein
MLNNSAPDPENDPPCNATVEPVIFTLPENIAGPMFVNVEEPETVNEPVIITVCFNGLTYEAVKEYDELTATDAVSA